MTEYFCKFAGLTRPEAGKGSPAGNPYAVGVKVPHTAHPPYTSPARHTTPDNHNPQSQRPSRPLGGFVFIPSAISQSSATSNHPPPATTPDPNAVGACRRHALPCPPGGFVFAPSAISQSSATSNHPHPSHNPRLQRCRGIAAGKPFPGHPEGSSSLSEILVQLPFPWIVAYIFHDPDRIPRRPYQMVVISTLPNFTPAHPGYTTFELVDESGQGNGCPILISEYQ